jgi:hypothetical protein
MTNKTTASPIPRGRVQRFHPPRQRLLAGAAALLALWLWVRISAGPSMVSRIAISNDTDYTVSVEVAGPSLEGWMAIGSAASRQVTVFQQVIDQGGTWTFRVGAQGHDGGQFTVSRADLVGSGWRVSLPPTIGPRLKAAGTSPDLDGG